MVEHLSTYFLLRPRKFVRKRQCNMTVKLSIHHYIVPFLHFLQLVLMIFGLFVHRLDWFTVTIGVKVRVLGLRAVSWDSPFQSLV